MPSKNNTALHRKAQPQPQLTDAEIARIAERLAAAFEFDDELIALLMLFMDHLELVFRVPMDFSLATDTFKSHLFIGTAPADQAQQDFRTEAYQNRAKLLQFPGERKGAA